MLLFWIVVFVFPTGAHSVEVKQDQRLLIVTPDEPAVLTCNQNDKSYLNMFWYQQKPGQGLKLMIYSLNADEEKMEEDYKARWFVKRPTVLTSSLHLEKPTSEDSTTYFCASSLGQGGGGVLYFGPGTVLHVLEEGKKRIEPKVKIYRPNKKEYKEHNLISLVCVADGFYPEHVRLHWYVNGIKRDEVYQNVPQLNDDNESYHTSKRLSLTRSEYFNPQNAFKCVAGFLDDESGSIYDEVTGEADCSVPREEYSMSINQGKLSYIMVLCKSGMYGIIALFIIWRRKVIAGS